MSSRTNENEGTQGTDPLIGQTLEGRYKIVKLIAAGGMGRVYEAEQTSLSRTVAVKVLSLPEGAEEQDPHFRERFSLEATTASKLSHPNTVTIFDHGRNEDDVYYIVMEYVDGITLKELLEAEEKLAPARALLIAQQVCRSLAEAHKLGIIHRDIKPANILLKQGNQEWVKVLDFGIAKVVSEHTGDTDLTKLGTYVGTPEYIAPESFRGALDARTDIYSVGVVLYTMLTGKAPLKGDTEIATVLMAVNDPVPPIDPSLGIPDSIQHLVYKCLEKEPILRWQSMGELLTAISHCLKELEGERFPPPPVQTQEEQLDLAELLSEVTDPSGISPRDLKSSSQEMADRAPKKSRSGVLIGLGLLLAVIVVGGWLALRAGKDAGPETQGGQSEQTRERSGSDSIEKAPGAEKDAASRDKEGEMAKSSEENSPGEDVSDASRVPAASQEKGIGELEKAPAAASANLAPSPVRENKRPASSGQNSSEENSSGQNSSEENSSGQNSSEENSSGQNSSEENSWGQNSSGQEKNSTHGKTQIRIEGGPHTKPGNSPRVAEKDASSSSSGEGSSAKSGSSSSKSGPHSDSRADSEETPVPAAGIEVPSGYKPSPY